MASPVITFLIDLVANTKVITVDKKNQLEAEGSSWEEKNKIQERFPILYSFPATILYSLAAAPIANKVKTLFSNPLDELPYEPE